MPETFITFDLMQHLEILRGTKLTKKPDIRVTTFTILTL